jgi:hypothetical protein
LRAAPEASAPPRPPLEAELVQQGKLTMGQLAQAHRDRLEKGGSVLDIVVERGWVGADDVAALREQHAVVEAAPPPPPRIPETTTAPSPAPAPEPLQQTAAPAEPAREAGPVAHEAAAAYRVAIRLSNGELIPAGEAVGVEGAEALAQVVVADVATADGDSWPYVSGRYIRPETIISVDILAAG